MSVCVLVCLSLCVSASALTCMHARTCTSALRCTYNTHLAPSLLSLVDAGAMRGYKRTAALLLLLAVSLVCLTEFAEAAKKRKKSKAKEAKAGPRSSEKFSELLLLT